MERQYDQATGGAFASKADGTPAVIHQDTLCKYPRPSNGTDCQGRPEHWTRPRVTHRVFVVSAKLGPPPAGSTAPNPRRHPPMIRGLFIVMVIERE
jgi:hypothetical protein